MKVKLPACSALFLSPSLPFPSKKKQYKENQATQKQRSQDQTLSTMKARLRNPNVDSYPNIS
jgi:hypothetical protein